MTDYSLKTRIELVKICKERGVRGYAKKGVSKAKIIELLKEFEMTATCETVEEYDKMKYDELIVLCKERKLKGYLSKNSAGSVELTKEKMIKLLKENVSKNNLFDYLSKNNPSIIPKLSGDEDILKTYLPGTNKYLEWKCDSEACSNKFRAIPKNVYKSDSPRKYCDICTHKNRKANKRKAILKRSGSIETIYPFIKNVWSNKNKKTPSEYSPGSNEKVTLRCPNASAKHPDYETTVYHIQETNCYRCPRCITKSSNAEMRIYSELKNSFKDVKWQQKIEGREADIIVEDIKLVIEVDGFPWHKDKSVKDNEKNIIFEKNGYSVLRIRDPRLDKISCDTIICNVTDITVADYNVILEWINKKFSCDINFNEVWKNEEYYKEIQFSKMYVKYEESIECLFPESRELWDYEKNYPLIPSKLSQGSCMEIWLKCTKGHSWCRKLSHLFRTIKDKKHIMKCPECVKPKPNKRIIQINGKTYQSILELCKQKDIDRNILYRQLKQNKIEMSSIESVQRFVEKQYV
jgi:very-short-patch-repair endonuclease